MSLQVAIIALIQSSVVLVLALIVCRLWRRNPYARLIVCRTALVAASAIIIGSPWLHIRPKPAVPVNVYSWNLTLFHPIDGPHLSAPSTAKAQPAPRFEPVVAPIDTGAIAGSIWILGFALAACGLMFGFRRLSRIRNATNTVDRDLLDTVRRVSSEFGVTAPEVRTGPDVSSPFVAGVGRPTLYLPLEWVDSSDAETIEAICRHEIAHLASQDLRWSLAHRVCSGFFWPQPLFIALGRAAATASEELSDLRVLSSGCSPRLYADSLITLKEGLPRHRVVAPLGIGVVSVRSAFGRRIKSIMETGMFKGSLNRPRKAALFAGCVAATVATTMMIAAPSWGQGSDAQQVHNPFAPMTGHAKVQVVTPDGKAAVGHAEVLLDDMAWTEKTVDVPIKDGSVDVDLAQYFGFYRAILVVQSPGYGVSFIRVWPVPKPVTQIRLSPPVSLTGRVFLPNGKPAAGESVYVEVLHSIQRPGSAEGPPVVEFLRPAAGLKTELTTRTDETGRFQIPGLPQGFSARLEVAEPQFACIANVGSSTELTGTEATVKDIHLVPAGIISGRITQEGKPVPGIRVGAQGQNEGAPESIGAWGDATTDASGYYRIAKLVAGHYNVSLMIDQTPLAEKYTNVAHEGVAVRAGETKIGNDMAMIPGGIIEGNVTHPDGTPIPGIEVGCYGPAHPHSGAWVQSVVADKHGHYTMRVPAGSQYVYVMEMIAPGKEQPSSTVETQDGQTTHVDLQTD